MVVASSALRPLMDKFSKGLLRAPNSLSLKQIRGVTCIHFVLVFLVNGVSLQKLE